MLDQTNTTETPLHESSNKPVVMRCKFIAIHVTKDMYGNEQLKASTVYGTNNAEDNTFSAATPSGSFEIMISNPAAQGIIEPGDTFYMNIVIAEKKAK